MSFQRRRRYFSRFGGFFIVSFSALYHVYSTTIQKMLSPASIEKLMKQLGREDVKNTMSRMSGHIKINRVEDPFVISSLDTLRGNREAKEKSMAYESMKKYGILGQYFKYE